MRRTGLTGPSRRYDPGRGGLLAMVAVAGLVALLVGGWVLSSRPHRIPAAAQLAAATTTSGVAGGSLPGPVARPSPSITGADLVVDVAGKVRHPGVYRLPAGARVQDAVTAAGGMAAGVDPVSVNLARRLTDGEQLVIGLAAAPEPAISGAGGGSVSGGSSAGSGSGGSGVPVDLNTAGVEQLDALPGVGPVLAQRIVDWRTEHGRFGSVDQLSDVTGIGAAKLADLAPLVTVS